MVLFWALNSRVFRKEVGQQVPSCTMPAPAAFLIATNGNGRSLRLRLGNLRNRPPHLDYFAWLFMAAVALPCC